MRVAVSKHDKTCPNCHGRGEWQDIVWDTWHECRWPQSGEYREKNQDAIAAALYRGNVVEAERLAREPE